MLGIYLDCESKLSLTRQLYQQIRSKIEEGELPKGTCLPPTRKLALELDIARNIVIEVYEQLAAEGFLESKTGSGTFVAGEINNSNQSNQGTQCRNINAVKRKYELKGGLVTFSSGIPDLSLFPKEVWGKYLKKAAEETNIKSLNYGDIQGDIEFRKQLSEYLFRIKGICCEVEQIFVTSGSADGFMLIASVFSKQVNSIFIEDPTIEFTRNVFSNMNYKITPIEVDQMGLRVDKFRIDESNERKLVLTTPSHQFPTGSVLSIQRRQKLIEYSKSTGSIIIEDDYDSEFRFSGIPVPAILTLAPSNVIFVGTFSKIMAPGIRLGFLIVPCDMVMAFKKTKSELNNRTTIFEQKAMANFIKDGHLERYIYKMKNTYKKRHMLVVEQLKGYFGNDISIKGDGAGLHLVVEFPIDKFPSLNWKKTLKYGVLIDSLEGYCMMKGKHKNKIVIGFGNLNNEKIKIGIKRLYQFIKAQ